MENSDNQELEPVVVTKTKTTKVTPLTDLELAIIGRSESLNIPALCAFFEVNEDVVKAALAKK
jgi:hypothetical protein